MHRMFSLTLIQVLGHFLPLIFSSLSAKVRLSGNGVPGSGCVEVFYNGVWGTVCDDWWDNRDAQVVCRMLGYNQALQASCCLKYGRGTGKIWLDDVGCTGREDHLFSCSHSGWGVHNCLYSEVAGVVCSNSTDPKERSVERDSMISYVIMVIMSVTICLLLALIVVLCQRHSHQRKQDIAEEVNLSNNGNEEHVQRREESSDYEPVDGSRNVSNEQACLGNESRSCDATEVNNRTSEDIPSEPADRAQIKENKRTYKSPTPSAFTQLETMDNISIEISHRDKPTGEKCKMNPKTRGSANPKNSGVHGLGGASGREHTYMELLTINREGLQPTHGARESNYQSLVGRKDDTSTG